MDQLVTVFDPSRLIRELKTNSSIPLVDLSSQDRHEFDAIQGLRADRVYIFFRTACLCAERGEQIAGNHRNGDATIFRDTFGPRGERRNAYATLEKVSFSTAKARSRARSIACFSLRTVVRAKKNKGVVEDVQRGEFIEESSYLIVQRANATEVMLFVLRVAFVQLGVFRTSHNGKVWRM